MKSLVITISPSTGVWVWISKDTQTVHPTTLEPLGVVGVGGAERYPYVPPKVMLVIPLGDGVEIPHNHSMVCVVSGFPEGDVLEQTAVCIDNVVHLGPHHPPHTNRSPCQAFLRP